MFWNRSNTLGLAKASCTHCHGNGIRVVRGGKEVPCQCVFRAVFRACYNRFRECATVSHVGTVTLDFRPGSEGRRSYSRKREEFLADFCIISRRALDELEQRIFRYHFLLGADWRLCCRQLHMDRGLFFHIVYRIQQKLGRAFAETEPYPLYPIADYFAGTTRPAARELQHSQPRVKLSGRCVAA
jgi:hypothetical protein